jgi:diadenosine tetraphosphatase ApaH/serine/threonine PP2A family protein phosphatase
MSSKWTARRLTKTNVDYLRGLPQELRLREDGVEVYFTHGSPEDRLWEYVDPRTHSDLFAYYLDKTQSRLMGLGHTHIPYVWKEGGRFVFNPGSVGQPRDGDRRASYAVVSIDGNEVDVQTVRVEYDYHGAASKIKEAGLPSSFADRLATGS